MLLLTPNFFAALRTVALLSIIYLSLIHIFACNEVDLLLFFRDPLDPKPHEPNDINLLRLCDMHNIPVATNIATAEVLIHGLERGDLDWRNILNPRY